MGSYLTPGHIYTDGSTVTGPNLTEHVAEATFKTTSVTDQTLRTSAALTDQVLVVASDVFYQETLQQIHDLILYPGCVVQTKYAEYTANTNLTAVLPNDDTVPQNTEGTEIISLSITPRFSTSTILARFQGNCSSSVISGMAVALFRDSVVNALAATTLSLDTAGYIQLLFMEVMDSPASASAITYKIRVGPSTAATMRMNGSVSGRLFQGVAHTTLVLQEIKV